MTNSFSNFHEAYLQVLFDLVHNPQFTVAPRGESVYEILNYHFEVENPLTHILWEETGMPERGRVTKKYHEKEHKWYLSGSLDANTAPASFWRTLQDDEGKITSNYGYMTLFDKKYATPDSHLTALEKVEKTLKNDPDSRQAVMHYGEPKHFWENNKDTPCCITNQFFIRNQLLFMSVTMRSNDVIKGLTYDYQWFTYLQKTLAKKLKIHVGPVSYMAHSMHLYQRDLQTAKNIITPQHF